MTKPPRKDLICPFCGHVAYPFQRSFPKRGESSNVWDVKCGISGCYLEDGADWWESYEVIIKKFRKRPT